MLQNLGIQDGVFSALSAALVMGVMLIPTVASLSEDAMSAVPRDLRDGAYALGSNRMQVSLRVVVPAAVSGIIASFVLAVSRAVGETMIVLIAAGGQPNWTFDPREAVQTMTAFIAATGRPRGRVSSGLFKAFLLFSMGVGIVTLGALLVTVVAKGYKYLDLVLLLEPPSADPQIAGARPAILATIYLGLLLIAFTVPIGVGTALYLEEYADRDRWYNRMLEVNIQNLAAVPSIVYGILGLAFLVRGLGLGRVLLAGAMILTLLVLPTVIIAAREAIRAVPDSIRQGAYALGATQWQVVWRQVLPAATPGIATGSILALSRGLGETAPLLLVGALTYVAFDPTILGDFTALPVQIYQWVGRPQEDFRILAASGIIVLLLILLTLNAFAIWLRNRYQRKW
jgi:phosphate transport system permease protein